MRRPAGAARRRVGRRGRALRLHHHADADLTALRRLLLHDFRNFPRLDWAPPAPRLLLVGPNGAGKTSLLEAIYLAATSRSFRAARLDACVRRGAAGFVVRVESGEHPTRELALGWSAGERERTLDGKSAPLAEHLSVLPVLAWSQADGELLTGGPEPRRRWLDRGLVHRRPAALDALARYRRALAEKRALLARAPRAGGETRRALAAWNELLARHGAELATDRAALAGELDAELRGLVTAHAPELPPLAVRYLPAAETALAGEAALNETLARAADAELARRMPLVGPHRDDFALDWDGASARRQASSGERKLAGILLLAALGRRLAAAGREPALLVDDADAELDRTRLGRLAAALAGFRALVVTTSRPEAWQGVEGLARCRVAGPDGGVRSEGGSGP